MIQDYYFISKITLSLKICSKKFICYIFASLYSENTIVQPLSRKRDEKDNPILIAPLLLRIRSGGNPRRSVRRAANQRTTGNNQIACRQQY